MNFRFIQVRHAGFEDSARNFSEGIKPGSRSLFRSCSQASPSMDKILGDAIAELPGQRVGRVATAQFPLVNYPVTAYVTLVL